jgi:hypothetical protein
MDVEAQDRGISQAHPNIRHPVGAGCGRRSAAGFPDPQGPSPAAADGGEDHGLSGEGRSGNGRAAPSGSTWPPPPLTDAGTAFLQAICGSFASFGGFALEEIRSRRWASITFQGARHALAFRLEGEGAEAAAGRFLSGLDARNFALRGHLLVDVSLVAEERRPGFVRIRLEALTVEEK